MKLIATCKTPVWKDLLEFDGIPTRLSRNIFSVEGLKGYRTRYFDEQEFAHMLDKYRLFYQYSGPFDTEVYEDCQQNPFLLRMMFEVASEHNLPYIGYTAIDFYREYFMRLCNRFDSSQRDMIQDVLIETARCFYAHNIDEVDLTALKASLNIPVTGTLPHRLFELNILERNDRDDTTYISFYFKKLRDYLIAFRALKWQTLSPQDFKSEIEKSERSGVHLEALNLYYSLTRSEEHKRVLDGQLYSNASAFLSLYECILHIDFSAFKQSFPPNTSGPIGFVGYVDFSHNVISMHGFRPLKGSEAKILLIPTASIPGAWMRENKGFLVGSSLMHMTDSSRGFQGINIAEEVLQNNVLDSLQKIIQQGQLNESQNKELLIERVFATCVTHCQDFFQKYGQNASSSYLPIRLKDLREHVLYKIAYAVLNLEYTDHNIASGQSREQWTSNMRLANVILSAQEQVEIEEQAWMIAKQGKNMAHEKEHLQINEGAFLSLLEDIDNLERLGLIEIGASPLTTWYDKHRTSIPRLQGSELFTEIRQLLENLYLSFLNEYQILVTRNFPTLCQSLQNYRNLPAKFSVALDTERYESNPQINPLTQLDILLQRSRENVRSFNTVVLSTPKEIYAEGSQCRTDPTFRGTVYHSSSARSIFCPHQSYISFEVKNNLCILRNLVYRHLEEEIKEMFSTLVSKYGTQLLEDSPA